MTIMQIAQTETLPIDENIFVGLSGLPKKGALQLTRISSTSIASRIHIFPIAAFFFEITWSKENKNYP